MTTARAMNAAAVMEPIHTGRRPPTVTGAFRLCGTRRVPGWPARVLRAGAGSGSVRRKTSPMTGSVGTRASADAQSDAVVLQAADEQVHDPRGDGTRSQADAQPSHYVLG